MTQRKDISVLGNLSPGAVSLFSDREREIFRIAQDLDQRFLPQFERRELVFHHGAEKMRDYLPQGLHDDANLLKAQQVRVSYNFWRARENPEQAETVICLSGIYNSARRFDFFAEGAAEHMNVIALDYPGKGYSENMRMPNDYTLDTYASLVRALIDHYQPQNRFHLLGHSHGAKVIYAMVDQGFSHPLWAGTIIGDMPPETPAGPKLRRAWRNRERPFSQTIELATKRLGNFLQGHGAPISDEFIIHDFNHSFAYFTREGYGWAYDPNSMTGYSDEYLLPYDKWQAYRAIPTPVLMLVGEKSNTATPDVVKRMMDDRPDISLLVYEGVGHYPELVSSRRVLEVCGWIQRAGSHGAPLRAMVPADPAKDMIVNIAQDNKSIAAQSAAKKTRKRKVTGARRND